MVSRIPQETAGSPPDKKGEDDQVWRAILQYDSTVFRAAERMDALGAKNVEVFQALLLNCQDRRPIEELEREAIRRVQGAPFAENAALREAYIKLNAEDRALAEELVWIVAKIGPPADVDTVIAQIRLYTRYSAAQRGKPAQQPATVSRRRGATEPAPFPELPLPPAGREARPPTAPAKPPSDRLSVIGSELLGSDAKSCGLSPERYDELAALLASRGIGLTRLGNYRYMLRYNSKEMAYAYSDRELGAWISATLKDPPVPIEDARAARPEGSRSAFDANGFPAWFSEKAAKRRLLPHRRMVLSGLGAIVFITVALATEPQWMQPGTAPGIGWDIIRDCSHCPELMVVPTGAFMMGGDALEAGSVGSEQPRHWVAVTTAFALGKYPVTRGEYAAFVATTGYSPKEGCVIWTGTAMVEDAGKSWRDPGVSQTDRDPVVCVSWDDAEAYAAWLASTTGKRYRLPTEAEWEYSARAGTTTARYWGDEIASGNANCGACGSTWDGKGTSPVGSFAPNRFGLSDMLGNVEQWVEDCWAKRYSSGASDASKAINAAFNGSSGDPVNPNCRRHVLRGSSWLDTPQNVRAGRRDWWDAGYRIATAGFRVARSP